MSHKITTKIVFFMLLVLLASIAGVRAQMSQWVDTSQNPLDETVADPGVFRDGNTYYMYPTGGYWFDCYESTNMIEWTRHMFAYAPPGGDTRTNFWAPEVIKRPSDGMYLMFYTAQMSDGRLRIHVAQSASPTSGFTDVMVPLFNTGNEAWIDPSPFIDTDGQAYLYVVKDVSTPGTGGGQGSIYVATIDLSTFAMGPLTAVLNPSGGWEARTDEPQDEGPYMVKHGTEYFLFFSGSGYWTSKYAVGYATSTLPTSGFTKYSGNPILKSGDGIYGPGHCVVVPSPDGTEYFMAYHAKTTSASGSDRQLCIDRLNFLGAPGAETVQMYGTKTGTANTLSSTPQMLPANSPTQAFFPASADFNNSLDRTVWHVLNENIFGYGLSTTTLSITGSGGDCVGAQSGIQNVFLGYAAQDNTWQVTAKLLSFDPTVAYQQAFVTIWQDQNNFARLSDIYGTARQFQVMKEEDGVTTSYLCANSLPDTKWIRVKKAGGHMYFSASPDGITFTDLLNGAADGYDVAWANGKKMELGIGCITPDGSGGSAPAITAIFDGVWYDRLTTNALSSCQDEFSVAAVNRDRWFLHNEDKPNLVASANYLRVKSQDGDWVGARTDLRNLVFQPAPSGDFTAITSVKTATIDANTEQAFIIVANNADNFVRFGRAYANARVLSAGVENGGTYTSNTLADPVAATTYEQLRIRKAGTTYYCESSANGTSWTTVGTTTATWTPLFMGIGAASPGSGHSHNYDFDWFHATQP